MLIVQVHFRAGAPNRTGVSGYKQGLDAEGLSKTPRTRSRPPSSGSIT
jgi:hypothetical protein